MKPNSKFIKISILQSTSIVAYCFLVALFFRFMETRAVEQPQFLTITILLLLLVVSAAITGTLVFGYAGFLIVNKKIKQGLLLLALTLVFCLLIFGLILAGLIIF